MKYFVYPAMIILTIYLALSIHSLTFDILSLNDESRINFAASLVIVIVADIGIELAHHFCKL